MIKSPSSTTLDEATPIVPLNKAVTGLVAKKKKKNKKKKKKTGTAVLAAAASAQIPDNAEHENKRLQEFINEPILDEKASLVSGAYNELYRKYLSSLFSSPESRTQTIIDVLSVIQKIKNPSQRENVKFMNVLHAILCGMDSNNETSDSSDLILYCLWHKMIAVYYEYTIVFTKASTNVLVEMYKEILLDSSMLIEHYRPKFASYIKLLEKEEYKATANKLFKLTNVGLWDSFTSVLNVDHYLSSFLINIGRIDEASKINARVEENLKKVNDATITAIRQNDPSNSYSETDLKQTQEGQQSITQMCLAANIEKFFITPP